MLQVVYGDSLDDLQAPRCYIYPPIDGDDYTIHVWRDSPQPQPSLVMSDAILEKAPHGVKYDAMDREVPPLVHERLRQALKDLLPQKTGNSKERKKPTDETPGEVKADPMKATSSTDLPNSEKGLSHRGEAAVDPSPKKHVPVDPASESVLERGQHAMETVEQTSKSNLDHGHRNVEQGEIGVLDPTNDHDASKGVSDDAPAPPSESHGHQYVEPVECDEIGNPTKHAEGPVPVPPPGPGGIPTTTRGVSVHPPKCRAHKDPIDPQIGSDSLGVHCGEEAYGDWGEYEDWWNEYEDWWNEFEDWWNEGEDWWNEGEDWWNEYEDWWDPDASGYYDDSWYNGSWGDEMGDDTAMDHLKQNDVDTGSTGGTWLWDENALEPVLPGSGVWLEIAHTGVWTEIPMPVVPKKKPLQPKPPDYPPPEHLLKAARLAERS